MATWLAGKAGETLGGVLGNLPTCGTVLASREALSADDPVIVGLAFLKDVYSAFRWAPTRFSR